MHKIDTLGSILGAFTDSNPATIVDDDWFNAVQSEIVNLIEAAGITLVKGTNTQLLAAVVAYIAAHNAVTNPHSAASAATASRLALRDAAGRTQFADPSAAQDAATKAYVDALQFAAPTWTIQTLAANWSSGSGIGAIKDRDGFLWLKGAVLAGTGAGTTIITLPAGMRPAAQRGFAIAANLTGTLTPVGLSVSDVGVVALQASPTAGQTFFVDSVRFLAEQ